MLCVPTHHGMGRPEAYPTEGRPQLNYQENEMADITDEEYAELKANYKEGGSKHESRK